MSNTIKIVPHLNNCTHIFLFYKEIHTIRFTTSDLNNNDITHFIRTHNLSI